MTTKTKILDSEGHQNTPNAEPGNNKSAQRDNSGKQSESTNEKSSKNQNSRR